MICLHYGCKTLIKTAKVYHRLYLSEKLFSAKVRRGLKLIFSLKGRACGENQNRRAIIIIELYPDTGVPHNFGDNIECALGVPS